MAVTIIDVARRAGVSKTTVSAVICEKKGVKQETREAVLEAIRELNYLPNFNARNFVQKKTNILGAIVLGNTWNTWEHQSYDFSNYTGVYSQDVITAINRCLSETNYGLITEYYDPKSGKLPQIVRDSRVDGLFVIGGIGYDKKLLEVFRTRDIPVMMVGGVSDEYDSFNADVEASFVAAVNYLIDKGHRKIGLLNCPLEFRSNGERFHGYMRALLEAGMPIDDSLVVNGEANTGAAGYNAIKTLFNNRSDVEAIVTSNVSITMGALRYIYERRMRIPDDISIVGHEDSMMYVYSSPAITAINIKKDIMSREAVSVMLRRLAKDKSDFPVRFITQPTLIERDSVKDVN